MRQKFGTDFSVKMILFLKYVLTIRIKLQVFYDFF